MGPSCSQGMRGSRGHQVGPGRPSEIEKQPSQVEIMPWEELPHCSEQTALHSVASHTQGVVGGGECCAGRSAGLSSKGGGGHSRERACRRRVRRHATNGEKSLGRDFKCGGEGIAEPFPAAACRPSLHAQEHPLQHTLRAKPCPEPFLATVCQYCIQLNYATVLGVVAANILVTAFLAGAVWCLAAQQPSRPSQGERGGRGGSSSGEGVWGQEAGEWCASTSRGDFSSLKNGSQPIPLTQ